MNIVKKTVLAALLVMISAAISTAQTYQGSVRGLVRDGFIGGLTAHAFTFMGGIYSSRRVREELAPAITERLAAERADLALLVPV